LNLDAGNAPVFVVKSTPKKRGRKQRPYVCPWDGRTIDGLSREPNGRWRIIGTHTRFREPDERLAVARYLAMIGNTWPNDAVVLKTDDPKRFGKEVAKAFRGAKVHIASYADARTDPELALVDPAALCDTSAKRSFHGPNGWPSRLELSRLLPPVMQFASLTSSPRLAVSSP
jgi:hypothetical protein